MGRTLMPVDQMPDTVVVDRNDLSRVIVMLNHMLPMIVNPAVAIKLAELINRLQQSWAEGCWIDDTAS